MANMSTRVIDGVTYWLLNITGPNGASGYAEKLLTASKYMDKSVIVSVPETSATANATYATLSTAGSSATSVTSQYFKITPSCSVVDAGWITAGSRPGTVQNYTIRSGSITLGATYAATGSAGTSPTTVSSKYFTVTPTASVGTTGWIGSNPTGSAKAFTIQDASFTTSGASVKTTASGGGWVGSNTTVGTISNAVLDSNIIAGSTNTGVPLVSTAGYITPNYLEGIETTGWILSYSENSEAWSFSHVNSGTTTPLMVNGDIATGTLGAAVLSPTSGTINSQNFTIAAQSAVATGGFLAAGTSSSVNHSYSVKSGSWSPSFTGMQETQTAGTWQMTSNTGSVTIGIDAGWLGNSTTTMTILAPTVPTGSLANESHKTSGVTYTTLTAPVLEADSSNPPEYWLYINEGYYNASKISLGTLVPDHSTPDATSDKLLTGYEAFDTAGHRIVGSMYNNGTATITASTSGTDRVFAIDSFRTGYYSAQSSYSLPIYQGVLE